MDNEYETMFKRLMNERDELRKYIIDICKLLGIDTDQSILGANCLEFYAVLCSTAENRIGDLQEQLKRKEQECNKLYIQLKADEEYHKEEENTLRKIIKIKEKRNIKLLKENNKLKQILIEIKEIAEEDFNHTCWEAYAGQLKQILQKISEVEMRNANLKAEYREKIKQLKEQLKNKEQECDKLKRVLAKISDIAKLFCKTY